MLLGSVLSSEVTTVEVFTIFGSENIGSVYDTDACLSLRETGETVSRVEGRGGRGSLVGGRGN